MLKKYALELFLIALFCGLVYLIYSGKKLRQTEDYYAKQAKIDSALTWLKSNYDSNNKVEQNYITKQTKIINYYDTKKDSVRFVPDTELINFIRAELGHFNEDGTAKSSEYFN